MDLCCICISKWTGMNSTTRSLRALRNYFNPFFYTNDSFNKFINMEIGSYRIEKQIGEGTFAFVRMGAHTTTEKEVAMKIIKPNSTANEDIEMEVKLMKLLNHPNIIKLYEVLECPDNGFQCLVMEYCPEGDLFDYIIKKGQLDESEAKKLFSQLLSAVEHMHSRNIVHRDIKPENLLLDADKNLKLSDFGLSAFCSPHTLLRSGCGSPLYSSPEVLRNLPYDGRAADVWALGVVLFAMVTGELPWTGPSLKDQVVQIFKGEFPLPAYLSMECKHLIKSILVVHPNKRATIFDIKNHVWLSKSRSMMDLTLRSPEWIMRMNQVLAQKRKPVARIEKRPMPSKSKRRSSPELNLRL